MSRSIKSITQLIGLLVIVLSSLFLLSGCNSNEVNNDSTTNKNIENKNAVDFKIDFDSNWIFSKYDVEVFIDNTSQGVLTHGQDAEYKLNLSPGTHTFSVTKSDDASIKGEMSFEITANTKIGYLIDCESDRIYIEQLETASTPISSSDTNGRTQQNLEDLFKNAGFTNITFNELHDLPEEKQSDIYSVDNVTIDNMNIFSEGDTFFPDDEVVISYHLPKDIKTPASANELLNQDYKSVAAQLEEAGFTEVITKPTSYFHDEINEYGTVQVVINSFPSCDDFEANQAFEYDTSATIFYNQPANDNNDDWDAEWDARNAFEHYGLIHYPYGFKCHWYLDLVTCERQDNGSYFIKVGVTITNEYGRDRRTYAQGLVNGSTVEDFYVS